ncbi:DsbA family protein [Variovorax sp. E3]|uniref:DsbA family protein n=1 Tax=Variovorax sp. E3 TaxID=1914993 RepID=UPI0018DAF7FE|nr:DsbA family protein [Variovorax sp. E3]
MSVIDFYFDFLSPYGYLAAARIESVAARHGRAVRWRPFRLGVAVVKVMGLRPNMETPLKAPYILRDIARLAKVLDLPLAPPPGLPNPLPPAQLFYAAPEARHQNWPRRYFGPTGRRDTTSAIWRIWFASRPPSA